MTDGGQRIELDTAQLHRLIDSACAGLGADVKAEPILAETMRNLYDGVPMDEVYKASILAARTLIEKDPDYTYATARLLLRGVLRDRGNLEIAAGERVLVAGGSGDGNRSGCGHAEGLFELLNKFAELQEGHLLESFEQLVSAELRHGGDPFDWW